MPRHANNLAALACDYFMSVDILVDGRRYRVYFSPYAHARPCFMFSRLEASAREEWALLLKACA